ncbi:MAG: Flagellar hook-length control protein FliK [Thermoleophilia bacterium]|nr:Flagellar hook-length control protein FliK [Thermoleophilia bacterium]
MKTPKAEGPQEPSGEHRRKPDGSRPKKRNGEHGPLGFGSVMRDVKGTGHPGASPAGATTMPGDGTAAPALPGSTTIGMPGFDAAMLQAAQLDVGAQAAMKMGAVETVGEQLADATTGVQDATEALQAQDKSVSFQANVQPHVPTPLGRMTPGALIETVLDESRKLEIAEAMKELHVELEPEDLGPVVVRLRKGPDGSLDISFRAREGEAARVLESGSELLRSRLFDAGFAKVAISVDHDGELQLTR